MKYRVIINKKSNKNINKMPQKIKDLMVELIDDLTNIIEVYYAGSRENAPY